MKSRKITSILLLTAMLAAVSCGTETQTSDTTAPDTTTEPVADSPLAFPKEDNGGRTFTILSSDVNEYEFIAEAETGEIVNDAIFRRNRGTEEYLGITLEILSEPGNWDDRDNFNALIANDVLAGDNSYDLVSAVSVVSLPIATQGVFCNLLELEGLDLTNEWWIQGLENDLKLADKLYFAIGDGNLSMYKGFNVVYFNCELLEQYKLENPYELVAKNEWTLDKFIEMASSVSEDLNDDGKITDDVDRFGYYAANVPNRSWQSATEVGVFARGDDGELAVQNLSERMVSVWEKLKTFSENPGYIRINTAVNFYQFARPLAEDRNLFMLNYLYATESEHLRNMKSDYGIVPYPKYDSEQKSFHTQIATASSVFFVPKTVKDGALCAKVMEVMSCLSRESVVPTYYETALKEKYSRDENVKEMLEIIRDSAQMSFDFIYSTSFTPYMNDVIGNAQGTLASYYESKKSSWEAQFKVLKEAYAKNED